ncbi:hypothetical protein H6G59_18660 [Anabaena lutea FACHB-196]|uniref:Uncharacterized protein n=1 Tax=Anabaena lutea FACHB-196 TaxID=2692881 RepID=A0ABR8FJD4_9NOST|nr:hypothetical protein [Anabaena lutea FACHB-196]
MWGLTKGVDVDFEKIDANLQQWQQGDYVIGDEHSFSHRFDPEFPLTDFSKKVSKKPRVNIVESAVKGFVVVTQTCDIVRSCSERPFVEVMPLVEVPQEQLNEIQRCRRPRYAFIPGAGEYCLVADLDRVMTLEKSVITRWDRKRGCLSDQDIRELGKALARKRMRFAFPDDFINLVAQLTDQFKKKHNKNSTEGAALRALCEIRVQALPSWDAPDVEIMFWFIRDEEQLDFQGTGWNEQMTKWLNLVPKSDRFKSVNGQVITFEDITAKEYIQSDPLDLDHLSS